MEALNGRFVQTIRLKIQPYLLLLDTLKLKLRNWRNEFRVPFAIKAAFE